ncbi:hypothetical protein P9112_014731 [Eukaryota sp. TZLM1-RC]
MLVMSVNNTFLGLEEEFTLPQSLIYHSCKLIRKCIYVNGKKLVFLAERLNSGLMKLQQASEDVANMKVELADKKVKLAVAVDKAKQILGEITTQTTAAQKDYCRSTSCQG